MKTATQSMLIATAASAALLVGTAGAATLTWQGGSGSFGDANWDNGGTANQNHPGNGSGAIETVTSSGSVSGFTNGAVGTFGATDTLTISGGAAIAGDFLNMATNTANLITLESGTITLSSENAFRVSGGGFAGFINFTGAAGSATITQTDLTGTTNQEMANKIGPTVASSTTSYFAIDGQMVASGVAYTGSNLAAVNTGLAGNVVNGRWFQIVETGTGTARQQTLTLVPEPGSLALLGLGGFLAASRRRRS